VLTPVCFTPDGAQLITHGDETRAIHIFDLRAIRRQLAEIGLDWDLPDYPPAPPTAPPLQVRVEMGDLSKRAEAARLLIKANQHTAAGNHAWRWPPCSRPCRLIPGTGWPTTTSPGCC
jgi:hypothetical protein